MLTLQGDTSTAVFTRVLQSVSYIHTGRGTGSSNGTREVSIYVVDSRGGQSETRLAFITLFVKTLIDYFLNFPNDTILFNTTFCESSPPIPIVGNVLFSTAESVPTTISELRLRINEPLIDDDMLRIDSTELDEVLSLEINTAQKFIIVSGISSQFEYENLSSKSAYHTIQGIHLIATLIRTLGYHKIHFVFKFSFNSLVRRHF